MKRFKQVLFCLAAAMAASMLFAAEPTISLTATPRYPWNGLVDLAFTIEGDEGAKYDTSFSAQDVVGGTNLAMKTVYKSPGVKANVALEKLESGTYNWLWDAPVDVGSDFMSESVVIDAKVGDAITYSVKFNANGGTGLMAVETFESGVAKALTANAFKRTGYLFQGWATNTTGSVEYSDKQMVSDLTTAAGGTVNLYAVWKDNSYSVKFNANGGTGTMANETMELGVAKALTANAFKRTGYTFQGWATSASGAKVYSDKQSVTDLTKTVGGTVNLYAVWKSHLYMVIDLSGGSSASSYPVSYLDAVPSGGWSDTYKKTKLVLRLCQAGSFVMGTNQQNTNCRVVLTTPIYVGVFEVTQKQYSLVCGTNPCSSTTYGRGDTYPVHYVSYNMIRGSSKGAKWPSSDAVDDASFMGKLRKRTGLKFDLPTDAQWEYVCRAGTTTKFYWGNSVNGNYVWYSANSGSKTNIVGKKSPNSWGLYDMMGNVWEWTLDWYGTLKYGTDPKGAASGTARVLRGSSWGTTESSDYFNTAARASDCGPADNHNRLGFRVSLPLE